MFSEFRRGALRVHQKFSAKIKTCEQQLQPPKDIKTDKRDDNDDDDEKSEPIEDTLMDILVGSPEPSFEANCAETITGEVDADDDANLGTVFEIIDYQEEEEMEHQYGDDVEHEECVVLEETVYDTEAVYLDDEESLDANNDVMINKDVFEINEDKSDSYLCELCNKYVKLTVKNHLCSADLTFP